METVLLSFSCRVQAAGVLRARWSPERAAWIQAVVFAVQARRPAEGVDIGDEVRHIRARRA